MIILLTWPWLPLIVAPFIGSLIGLLILRLPAGVPVGLERSRCDNCQHLLAPMDLIPLLSFFALRGRCRYCRSEIGWLPLLSELAAFFIALIAILTGPSIGYVWGSCVLGWVLVTLAWIDWRTMQLPDVLTLPLIMAGLLMNFWLDPRLLVDGAIGVIAGYIGFWLIASIYRYCRGREGLGRGDAKLLGAGGAWLGWALLPDTVLIAASVGLVAATIGWCAEKVTNETRLPFGPCIALSIWIVWLYRGIA